MQLLTLVASAIVGSSSGSSCDGTSCEGSSFIAVHMRTSDSGDSRDLSEIAVAVPVCQGFGVNYIHEGDTIGEVKGSLHADCKDGGWYSVDLCNEVLDELFKDKDGDALFAGSDCAQLQGLIQEHWKHQNALHQRAQLPEDPEDLALMESDIEHNVKDKGDCDEWKALAKQRRRPYSYNWVHQGLFNGRCKRCWNEESTNNGAYIVTEPTCCFYYDEDDTDAIRDVPTCAATYVPLDLSPHSRI